MYLILKLQMERKKLSVAKTAMLIGVTEKTLRNKIKGKTDFTWTEVLKLKSLVGDGKTIEELFKKE